jgi:TPR repeat protein
VLCPTCHESNPDSNRFCGHCGTVLSAKYTPARRSGDQLPKELIEFDKKIPLIAEPGTDRRSNVPENIREKVQEVLERDRAREADREREAEAQRETREREIAQKAEREVEAQHQRERELEAQRLEREREIARARERELERNRVTVPAEEEERPIQLPSGFLGLNVEPSREVERVAPANRSPFVEEQHVARKSNNNFLAVEDQPRTVPTGVVGPSFLGLSDSLDEVEQDEPESHARIYVALFVLLVLIGLGATQWKAIRDQGLPFVKNGTQQVMLKIKGQQAQPAPQDSSNAANTNGTPNMEVAPLNENLKKQQEAANAANGTPAADANAANPSANNTAATNDAPATPSSPDASKAAKPADSTTTNTSPSPAENAAATPATTGGAVGAAIPDGGSTSKTDEGAASEPAKPVAKDTEKPPASDASPRSRRKPSGADRPQITEEPTQAGNAEYERALATSDPGLQRALLWQAVKKGNSDASVRLAELYIAGRGVEKSCDQAMVLLRSASAHSSSRARGKLGAMYATGECVPQDRVQAYHWMSMALQANPNSDWTARYRDNLWNQMTAAEKMRAGRDR